MRSPKAIPSSLLRGSSSSSERLDQVLPISVLRSPAPEDHDHEDEDPLHAAEPHKLQWMSDAPATLAKRIPTSVFALGDLAA